MDKKEIRRKLQRAKRVVLEDARTGRISPRTYFSDGQWAAFEEMLRK